MVECIVGVAVGLIAGLGFRVNVAALGGLASLVVFLALADELVAALIDSGRHPVFGLLGKGVFCVAVFWLERVSGAPLVQFLVLVFLWSIYRRLMGVEKVTAAGVK